MKLPSTFGGAIPHLIESYVRDVLFLATPGPNEHERNLGVLKYRFHGSTVYFLTIASVFVAAHPCIVLAHCDAENGPVAVAAREALESENFQTIAIWVGEEQEAELRSSLEETLPVYRMGGEAKALAQRYFVENSVRLHRVAEGMSYTGLAPAQPLPPDIATAEEALETGNLKPLVDLLSDEMQEEVRKWYQKAHEAQMKYKKSGNVDLGREWVDAYVKYVIYVHGIHETIQAGPEHGVGHVESIE